MNFEFFLLSLITIFVLVVLWLNWPAVIGAIFVPTPMHVVGKMLEMAGVSENDTLIDLGSGDGRIIIEAAKKHGATTIGIEADPLRVIWSRLRVRSNGLQEKVNIIWGNFFNTDISKATVVTIYQGQDINKKLIKKLEKELQPGTLIVSYYFTFDGWIPHKKNTESDVYLYELPMKTRANKCAG